MAIGMGAAIVGAAAIGAASGYAGGRRNLKTGHAWSTREREASQDWEEKMRGNQYQVAVEDMKAAGINPMVAYQQGGAGNLNSSPGPQGSASGGGDFGDVASSAVSAMKLENENKIATASVSKINADAHLSSENARVSSATAAIKYEQLSLLQKKQERERKYGASAVGNLIDTSVQTFKSIKRGAGKIIEGGKTKYRKAGKFAKPPTPGRAERRRQRRSKSQIEENKARAKRNSQRGK